MAASAPGFGHCASGIESLARQFATGVCSVYVRYPSRSWRRGTAEGVPAVQRGAQPGLRGGEGRPPLRRPLPAGNSCSCHSQALRPSLATYYIIHRVTNVVKTKNTHFEKNFAGWVVSARRVGRRRGTFGIMPASKTPPTKPLDRGRRGDFDFGPQAGHSRRGDRSPQSRRWVFGSRTTCEPRPSLHLRASTQPTLTSGCACLGDDLALGDVGVIMPRPAAGRAQPRA